MAVNENIINELELRKAIEQLHPDGHLFEVRIIGGKKPLSGYFKDADTLLRALKTVDLRGVNVYVTLNEVDGALFSRQQSERFMVSKTTTNDKDIIGYRWLFIDMDPIRPAGISAARSEVEAAVDLAGKVYSYLKDLGFEEPVRAISGNGAHLLYRIGLLNSEENSKLVEDCLKALSYMFDNDMVQVDTANFNPSRICKLYGTLAQKGANTVERPHRMSKIYGDLREVKQTDKAYLMALASQLPQAETIKPERYNSYNPTEFDIEDWMREHFISYRTATWRDGCTKYVLEHCPFDHNHKAPDSSIIKQSNGAIGFKCLHNSCKDKTWRDVRLLFEPDAYDEKVNPNDAEIEAGYQRMKHNRDCNINYSIPDLEQPSADRPVFSTAKMILDMPTIDEEFILTGIDKIDKASRGLIKGGLSIVSGLRGASKSTLLSQIILKAVDDGHNVVAFSGELTNKNFMRWMYQQAAGKKHVKPSKWEGFYYVPKEIEIKIAEWLGEHFWLYNNDYGNGYVHLKKALLGIIAKSKADLVILDNLMALNISELDKDKYEAQSKFVNDLAAMAKLTNTHIMFVAHPRKAQGFLRLDDVAGTGDLTNAVDQAFIVHRNNNDFQRLSKQAFGWREGDPVYSGTNVIEIAKDRQSGAQDVFIPLWYERESKRLKNTDYEMIAYGWDEESKDGFMDIEGYQGEIPF